MIHFIVLYLLSCAVAFGQGYVWNPFTKRLDKVGTGGGGAAGYATIQDEGVDLTPRPTINFTGAGVTAADDAVNLRTNVSIGGGGGGAGLNSFTGSLPIVTGGTLTDPTVKFGYNFTSTITAATYTVVAGDCGTIKRFFNATGVAVSLPLLAYPCVILFFNDNVGPAVITASSGDINGDTTLVLQSQEGASLSLHQGVAFWRGITVTGRVQSGTASPAAARCNESTEAGQLYVRTDAAAADSSLYVCANNGVGTYAWEGPIGGAGGGGGASQFSDLTDFKATATSGSTLTIAPGLAAVGNYAYPTSIGGAITFSGGTGSAVVFLDETGTLITQAATGITQSALTGQMTFQNASTPTIPETAVPICHLAVSAGTYTITTCGEATRVRNSANKAGNGLIKTVSNGVSVFAVDPAVVCLTTGNCTSGVSSGAGAPSGASCTSLTVGTGYTDTNVGGDDWKCRKVASATYLWIPTASPSAATSIRYRDDLVAGLSVSGNGSDGNLQLTQVGTGSLAFLAGEASHYGIRRYTSGTTTDNNGGAVLSGGSNLVPNLATTTGFFARLVLRTDPSSLTSAVYCAGFCGSTGSLSTSLAALFFDKGAAHTTWHFRTATAGTATGTDTDTGVTVTTAQWADVSIWSLVAGTVCYSLNGGAETCHSANVPPSATSLAILSGTRSGPSAYAVDIDLLEFTMWGLTR